MSFVVGAGEILTDGTIRDFAPIRSDEPGGGLGGTDSAPNPVKQVLAALGSCLAASHTANASASGIQINDLRDEVEGDLDLHAFLGFSDGNVGFETIEARVHLDADVLPDELQALHAKVTGTSPVRRTLGRSVPTQIELS